MYQLPSKPEKIDFSWIFSRISQEEVYLFYLGFCELNKKFINPLRTDKKPDCKFFWYNNTLFFRDFAINKTYSCVTIVMEIRNLNYYEALDDIYEQFIGRKGNSFVINKQIITHIKQEKDIKCKIQPFTKTDIEYLKQYGISSIFCKKANWYSIKHYWINNELMYTYSNSNPCIGYYFPVQKKWKLYFYLNKNFRFLSTTTSTIIQGWEMLPERGDNLIITKSFKDVGTLFEQNIPSIAPQAESILLPKIIINELKQRFVNIYSLMDYDNTGIHLAWQMRKLYDIKPYFFTDKTWNRKGKWLNCKDVSDFRKTFGYRKTKELWENKL